MPTRYRVIERERGNGSVTYHTQFNSGYTENMVLWSDYPHYPRSSRFNNLDEAMEMLYIIRSEIIIKETVIS